MLAWTSRRESSSAVATAAAAAAAAGSTESTRPKAAAAALAPVRRRWSRRRRWWRGRRRRRRPEAKASDARCGSGVGGVSGGGSVVMVADEAGEWGCERLRAVRDSELRTGVRGAVRGRRAWSLYMYRGGGRV